MLAPPTQFASEPLSMFTLRATRVLPAPPLKFAMAATLLVFEAAGQRAAQWPPPRAPQATG